MQNALGLMGEQWLMFAIMVALGIGGIAALFMALLWPKRWQVPYRAEVIFALAIAAIGAYGAINSQINVDRYQAAIPDYETLSGKVAFGDDAKAFDRVVSVYLFQWGMAFIDGDGRASRNALAVKPGERVLVHVLSNDVIHGFQIPAVRLTTEVDPKAVRSVWFRAPAEPGKYLIQCIDYCGIGHHQMKAWLVVRGDAPEKPHGAGAKAHG